MTDGPLGLMENQSPLEISIPEKNYGDNFGII